MGAWQQLAGMPSYRYQAAATYYDGKCYIFGGIQSSSDTFIRATTFIYDVATNTWSSGASMPAGLHSGFAFVVGTKIHVLTANNQHYRYDPATDSWDLRANNTTRRFRTLGLQLADGRIILAGGTAFADNQTSYAVERYDPATNTWTALPAIPYEVLQWNNPAIMGDDGRLYSGVFNQPNVVVYDPAAGTWSRTANAPQGSPFASPYIRSLSRLVTGKILTMPGNHGAERRTRIDGYDVATNTWSLGVIPDYPGPVMDFWNVVYAAGFTYVFGGQDNYYTGVSALSYVYLENRVPNAPVLRTMVGGALVSTASPNRAAHIFNDPDTGDSQSKFEVRYRLVGDVTWTTIVVPWPNPFYDFPPGEFTPGDYERQVRTWDAGGLVGPWCTSGFFTAADPPAGPSITYPINGQDVEQTETLVWSTAEQDAYQVRRVADNAGDPDEGVVYFDTGEVTAPLPRSLPLTFETNDRPEHIQVRVKFEGLWSEWISVMVNVDYTEPMVPSFVIYPEPDTASLQIMITNPAPTGGAPVTVYNDVYVTESGVEERKATELPTNEGWRFWTPQSGRDYSTAIRVVAVAANGTTASTP